MDAALGLPVFERPLVKGLRDRLGEPRRFIQVVAGPRQVGKTTLVAQALEGTRALVVSGDDAPATGTEAWLRSAWEQARRADATVFVVDEVQRITHWSRVVKSEWDADTRVVADLRVVLLGSAPLAIEEGLAQDLGGRFELLRADHWTLAEMRAAFGFDLETYLRFGGYPGVARGFDDPNRWASYVTESLIEPTLGRDVFALRRVDKPSLLRGVLEVACALPAQVVSYTKMLGTLQDRGNAATVAHHLRLLEGAGLVAGIPKHSTAKVRTRGSSPKLIPLAPALITASSGRGLLEPFDATRRGRVLESAAIARAWTWARNNGAHVTYWLEGNREVDLVVERAGRTTAIEIKSARPGRTTDGLDRFCAAVRDARPIMLSAGEHEAFLDDPGPFVA